MVVILGPYNCFLGFYNPARIPNPQNEHEVPIGLRIWFVTWAAARFWLLAQVDWENDPGLWMMLLRYLVGRTRLRLVWVEAGPLPPSPTMCRPLALPSRGRIADEHRCDQPLTEALLRLRNVGG